MDDAMEDYGSYGEGGTESYEPPPPEERFPPTEPGELGRDPVLNDYADSCFAGDLQACDDLYYGGPPLSEYEQYAVTCGGRIKPYMAQSAPTSRLIRAASVMVEVGAAGP